MTMNRRHFIQYLGGTVIVAGKSSDSFSSINNTVNDSNMLLHSNKESTRLSTNYYGKGFRLDRGSITVIAARPSLGKSNLIQNIVQDASMSQSIAVGYMSHVRKPLLFERMVAAQCVLGDCEKKQAASTVTKFSIVLDDTPQMTLDELHASIETMVRKHNIRLLTIDGFDNIYLKNTRTDVTVSRVFTYLKELAQNINIPVIISIGLNRDLENRKNKRPRLTDLYNYRVVEQTVDSMLYLYRDEIYEENSKYKGKAEIRFENSDGRNDGTFLFSYNGRDSCFRHYNES